MTLIIRRRIKALLLTLTTALLLIAVTVFCLLSSDYMTNKLSAWVNQQDWGLTLDYQQGNLLDGIQLHSLELESDDIHIYIQQLQATIDYRCLLRGRLCLQKIQAQTSRIRLLDTAPQPEAAVTTANSENLYAFSLPIPISIELLQSEALHFIDKETHIYIEDLQLQASLSGNILQLHAVQGRYEDITIVADGQLEFYDYYPLHVTAAIKQHDLNIDASISAIGDLKQLKIQAQNNGLWPVSITATVDDVIDDMSLKATAKTSDVIHIASGDDKLSIGNSRITVHGNLHNIELEGQLQHLQWQSQDGAIPPMVAQANFSALFSNNSSDNSPQQAYSLTLKALNILSPLANLNLHGMLNSETRTLEPTDASPPNKATYNSFNLQGSLSQLDLSTLALDENLNSDLQTQFTLSGSLTGMDVNSLSVELALHQGQGLLAAQPVTFSMLLVHKPETLLDIRKLAFASSDNRLQINGQGTQKEPIVIAAQLNNMSQFLPDSEGDIHANLKLYSSAYDAKGELQLNNGNWQTLLDSLNIEGHISSSSFIYDTVQLQKSRIDIEAYHLLNKASKVRLSFDRITLDQQQIEQSQLTFSGTQAKHQLQLRSSATELAQVNLSCEGTMQKPWRISNSTMTTLNWLSTCSSFKLQPALEAMPVLTNATAITLNFQQQLHNNNSFTLSLNSFCLQGLKHGKHYNICSQKNITVNPDGLFDIDIAAKNIAMANIAEFIHPDLSLEGEANFSLVAQWPEAEGKSLHMSINADDTAGVWQYALEEQQEEYKFKLDALNLNIEMDDTQAQINSRYQSSQLGTLKASIIIDDIQQRRALSGDVYMQSLSLEPLAQFSDEVEQTAGSVNGSLRLSGTLEKPQLQGQLQLSNGLLLTQAISNRLDDIQLHLNFDLHQANLNGTVDIDGSPLATTGQLLWKDENWQAKLGLNGKYIPFNYPPIEKALLTPDVEVLLQQDSIQINGTLSLNETLVEMQRLPETAYEESSDVVFVGEDVSINAETDWQMQADLTLLLKDNVKFKGFGADVSLKGDLRYLQRSGGLAQGHGEIIIDEGEYTFWGQHLEITEGSFIFAGPLDNPDIRIKAIREIESENLTVGIHGYGPLEEPTFDVFSSKSMDNQTAMHYLITGRAPDKDAAEGTDLLSTALLARGVSGAENRSGDFAEKIGIRDFKMSTASNDIGTEVQLSGYISDKIFIRYGMGLFDRSNTFTVRYQLMPQLFVETASGLDSTIDLIYSFEVK